MPIYEVKDDLLPFRKDGTESFSMLPVGTIFASAVPQTDARVRLLDGSTISQTGIYKTFANLIKSLVAAGHNITYSSDTEFYSDVSTYGQCGKFVIDDVNGTIRLPLITEFIASNNGGKEIGLAQLDAFKSHQHPIAKQAASDSPMFFPGNSAYVAAQGEGNYWWSTTNPQGDSETRPKNIRYPYYIVLAAGYKSDQVVDMDNIVSDLNNKQDKIKVLWERAGAPMGETQITLNSSDYDYLLLSYAYEVEGGYYPTGTVLLKKGQSARLWDTVLGYYSTLGDTIAVRSRAINYVNETTLNVLAGYAELWRNGSILHKSNTNYILVPLTILGVKL